MEWIVPERERIGWRMFNQEENLECRSLCWTFEISFYKRTWMAGHKFSSPWGAVTLIPAVLGLMCWLYLSTYWFVSVWWLLYVGSFISKINQMAAQYLTKNWVVLQINKYFGKLYSSTIHRETLAIIWQCALQWSFLYETLRMGT